MIDRSLRSQNRWGSRVADPGSASGPPLRALLAEAPDRNDVVLNSAGLTVRTGGRPFASGELLDAPSLRIWRSTGLRCSFAPASGWSLRTRRPGRPDISLQRSTAADCASCTRCRRRGAARVRCPATVRIGADEYQLSEEDVLYFVGTGTRVRPDGVAERHCFVIGTTTRNWLRV
jgi:hypothetical protein